MNIKARLILMNFLQFAVWGAYLTSMGTYLAGIGLGNHIGIFYAMQGIVSLFMPAIMGIIAGTTSVGHLSLIGRPVYGRGGILWNGFRKCSIF